MSLAVVGFDVGSLTSYIAVAKGGGIETIANEYSDRCTPTCVAFVDNVRLFGAAAKQRQITDVRNTLTNFSRLVGKKFSDPAAQREMSLTTNMYRELEGNRIGIQLSYMGQDEVFTPEQVVAMQLTKLAELAEANLGTKVVEVVVNVPTFYTDTERRALMDASRIAGLNCVRTVNDTTAIGIAYGLYNKDLPEPDQDPRIVAFVNMGNSSLQVAICSFNKGKMRVHATACDAWLGGRDFDNIIYEYVYAQFLEKYKIDVNSSPKAKIRLLQECEKLKKLMSANSTALPLNIECFMDDIDVSTFMKREDFESLAGDLLKRIENTLRMCITKAKVTPAEVTYVELVGGSTRVPAVKRVVSSVFGQDGRTTLNADEAVVRGCALQAAICSPSFKVREFSITDACPYGIVLRWDDSQVPVSSNLESVEMDSHVVGNKVSYVEVMPQSYPTPCTRQFTFTRHSDFTLEACYANPEELPNGNSKIGVFNVTGVTVSPSGEPSTIKVKVRMNASGIFTLSHAQLVEKQIVETEMEPDTTEPVSDVPANGDDNQIPERATENEVPVNNPESTELKKKKKVVTKHKDLLMIPDIMQFSQQQLMVFTERESHMIAQDRLERERSNAKNSVEEYVYYMRDKLSTSFERYVEPSELEALSSQLTDTEDWLYGEGEDLAKQAYMDRLKGLQLFGDRIENRAREAEQRPELLDKFKNSVAKIRKILEAIAQKDESYSHITPEEIAHVQNILQLKESWLNLQALPENNRHPNQDPVILCSQISAEREAMDSICLPILTKPKPAPPQSPPKQDGSDSRTEPNLQSANPESVTPPKKGVSRSHEATGYKVSDVNGDRNGDEAMETD